MNASDKRDSVVRESGFSLRKVKNGEKLIERLISTKDEDQIMDTLAEVDVALRYMNHGFYLEYEPDMSQYGFTSDMNPPDFRVSAEGLSFFVEVKRVRIGNLEWKQDKIIKAVSDRISKIQHPYSIGLALRMLSDDIKHCEITTTAKAIADSIKAEIDEVDISGLPQNEDKIVVLNSKEIAVFGVFRRAENRGHNCVIGSQIKSIYDRTDKIRSSVREANTKSIPENSIYLVICDIEGLADEYEITQGITSEDVTSWFYDGPVMVAESTRTQNRTLGHREHYRKISGVFVQCKAFRYENLFRNEEANTKIDDVLAAKIVP